MFLVFVLILFHVLVLALVCLLLLVSLEKLLRMLNHFLRVLPVLVVVLPVVRAVKLSRLCFHACVSWYTFGSAFTYKVLHARTQHPFTVNSSENPLYDWHLAWAASVWLSPAEQKTSESILAHIGPSRSCPYRSSSGPSVRIFFDGMCKPSTLIVSRLTVGRPKAIERPR